MKNLVGLAALLAAANAAGCTKTESPEPEHLPQTGGGGGATACPQGLPGPKLIALPAKDGSFYCMDQRETTWNEYKAFADAKGQSTSGQPKRCSWNDSYMPKVRQPGDDSPVELGECTSYDELQANGDGPAFCVDFCDAWAYCAWAGKRLCRETDAVGSEPAIVSDEQAEKNAASTKSEWTNACSQGGKTKYAYGNELVPGKCIDEQGPTKITALDQRDCHGTISPFSNVYDLDGSVAEWVDSCIDVNCTYRGNSPYVNDPLDCGLKAATRERAQVRAIGIRCCASAVPPGK